MRAQERQRGRREPGLHHGTLVGEVQDTASVASSGMGVPATAVIAVVGAATCSTSRATSVVVPLRLIATMRS